MFKRLGKLFNSGSDNKDDTNKELLPIPRHLTDILHPAGSRNNEHEVTGTIACTCGSEHFTLSFAGDDSLYKKDGSLRYTELNGDYFLIVNVTCNSCKKDYLIFDNHAHGWDGFIANDAAPDAIKSSMRVWECIKCGSHSHNMAVTIRSAGKSHFMEETDNEFSGDEWKERFGSIDIAIVCQSCEKSSKQWITCETS